jgi:hypothetical protein
MLNAKIWRVSLLLPCTKKIDNWIFSNRSSFLSQLRSSGHTCVHVYQQTRAVNERTRWSNNLLEIFDAFVLPLFYKLVGMKYSRRGGTKVWFRVGQRKLRWSLVATSVVKSFTPIATMMRPACQWQNAATSTVTTSACCYYGLLLPRTKYFYKVSIPIEQNDQQQNEQTIT